MRVPHSEDFPVIIGSIILCNSLKAYRKNFYRKVPGFSIPGLFVLSKYH